MTLLSVSHDLWKVNMMFVSYGITDSEAGISLDHTRAYTQKSTQVLSLRAVAYLLVQTRHPTSKRNSKRELGCLPHFEHFRASHFPQSWPFEMSTAYSFKSTIRNSVLLESLSSFTWVAVETIISPVYRYKFFSSSSSKY